MKQAAGWPARALRNSNSQLSLINQPTKVVVVDGGVGVELLRHWLRSLIHLICLHSHSAKTIHQFSSRVELINYY